jgi:hypothetical protein
LLELTGVSLVKKVLIRRISLRARTLTRGNLAEGASRIKDIQGVTQIDLTEMKFALQERGFSYILRVDGGVIAVSILIARHVSGLRRAEDTPSVTDRRRQAL